MKLQLSIVVDEDGSVGSVRVVEWPAGLGEIVLPAIRAVRGWKYKPGLLDGRPVKVALPVEVGFEN